MDIRRLRLFVKVSEAGSFSRASAALGMSQPALSRQVRLLEEELGTPLLWRDGRGVRPTESGLHLLEPARNIIEQIDQLTQEILTSKATPSGVLSVGMTPSMNMLIAAPLIRRFNQRFPQVHLSILELLSGHLEEWLVSDRVDIGIVYHPHRARTLITEKIGEEPLSLVHRAEPGGETDRTIHFGEIAEMQLVLPSRGNSIRAVIENAAKASGLSLRVTLEVDSLYAIKHLVAEGEYRTIIPSYIVAREIEDGLLSARRIVNPSLNRVLLLATGHSNPSSALKELRREILAVLRDTHIR